jgi:pyruvate/2-oxoglutarate dehydrogenase complex dihydrolipoamide dehydrogenase (E3) component
MRLVGERFDLVVLGGGSAARDAANMAMRDYDARVALVERERWGGSCPNVACSPTKAYLVAAELAHDVNRRAPVSESRRARHESTCPASERGRSR